MAARPYRESLARRTPSSKDGTTATRATGPNISSVMTSMDSSTPVSTVAGS